MTTKLKTDINDKQSPYAPGGVNIPLPDRSFVPINPRGPIVRTADAPGSSNPYYYNPYGGGAGSGGGLGPNESPYAGDVSRGKFKIYGGKDDLRKTVATRSIGTAGLMDLLNQQSDPRGAQQHLSQLYGNYAKSSGDSLLAEAYSNASPAAESARLIAGEQNRTGLTDLLNEYYKMGGEIYGTDLANTGSATQLYNAQMHKKVDEGIGWTAGIPFVGGLIHGGLEGFNG